MIVKICANKSIEEAQMCLNANADVIGILVGQEHSSTDFVDKETAKQICDYVNGRCDVSLVTHLLNADERLDSLRKEKEEILDRIYSVVIDMSNVRKTKAVSFEKELIEVLE